MSITWRSCPDGKTLASSLNNGTIRLWNTQTGELSRILIGHTYHVFLRSVQPRMEKMLVSGSYDGTPPFCGMRKQANYAIPTQDTPARS